jgi:hypothetical protein
MSTTSTYLYPPNRSILESIRRRRLSCDPNKELKTEMIFEIIEDKK